MKLNKLSEINFLVQTVFSGEWDIRKAAISGKRARLQRYFYKLLDEPNVKIREAVAQGQNVTQFYLIYDLKGYNLVEQGCLPCKNYGDYFACVKLIQILYILLFSTYCGTFYQFRYSDSLDVHNSL